MCHQLTSNPLQIAGGYYTIEQTKSRLRIIALNTNYMRHDVKYSQSHSSALRQRDGSLIMQQHNNQNNQNGQYHRKHYHHESDGSYSSNSHRYNQENKYYTHEEEMKPGATIANGGTVSALSGAAHESEKQWEWLEETLAKSSKNKETVSPAISNRTFSNKLFLGIYCGSHPTWL